MLFLKIKMHDWFCYILISTDSKYSNRTYIGKTCYINKRIRQHNGNLSGGAKYTHVGRPYQYACIISEFVNETEALRFEYRLKHPNGKYKKWKTQNTGLSRRMDALYHILKSDWYKETISNPINIHFSTCVSNVCFKDEDIHISFENLSEFPLF